MSATENERWHMKGYELGIVAASEAFPKWLMEKSGTLFMEGKDSDAKMLRSLAIERTAMAQKLRNEYASKHQIGK